MNRSRNITIVLLLAVIAGAASAQETKTRAQVRAEVTAAMHNGDMLTNGETGMREKDMFLGLYPADPVVAGKTRAEVKAELAQAIRDGDMMANDETGMTAYELQPQRYAHQRAIDAAARLAQQNAAPTRGSSAQ